MQITIRRESIKKLRAQKAKLALLELDQNAIPLSLEDETLIDEAVHKKRIKNRIKP